MLTFKKGNLLESKAEALVNTVNTVGVMGKGVALMFKEAFPDNFQAYRAACKKGEVRTGEMFVFERKDFIGPRWIINFPTKQQWWGRSKMEWIEEGLLDLKRVIIEKRIESIAIPPLGSGNGGLNWNAVAERIISSLGEMSSVEVMVYEPTPTYQNVAKRKGIEGLTPARALIAEIIRRYGALGFECSLLEAHKLAYLLEYYIAERTADNPLNLNFSPNRFGPYADRLRHLLDDLDGSYLHCDKRLGDAEALDAIWFDKRRTEQIELFIKTGDTQKYADALDVTTKIIEGFQSPLGLELLATVHWLIHHHGVQARVPAIKEALRGWPGGSDAGERKLRIFDDRLIGLAVDRLSARQALSG